jgi:hypothetical protein
MLGLFTSAGCATDQHTRGGKGSRVTCDELGVVPIPVAHHLVIVWLLAALLLGEVRDIHFRVPQLLQSCNDKCAKTVRIRAMSGTLNIYGSLRREAASP